MTRLTDLLARRASRPPHAASSRRPRPLNLEALEDRTVPAPAVLDPNLGVRTAVGGLALPTGMAFLGDNDFFALEKNTGKVQHVINGVVAGAALDLPVNNNSERGLLGIALSPNFANDRHVYLYWTQSSTGADSAVVSEVPLLGNRVDRFVWNGSTLTFDRNIIQLRALQDDATNGRQRGNHNGGVIRFGLDGKLYVIVGDVGRRGWMQNLEDGPFGPGQPDDQFGGPYPDDAHLTGVILRLNPDGSAPRDNPFFKRAERIADSIRDEAGDAVADQVAANLKKVYAYGVRNSFGMAIDPFTGNVWNQENGDDSFDEINRVEAGDNNGWVQVMGPIDRVAQFKAIETSQQFFGLQQVRWSPANIADTPSGVRKQLLDLPGSHYSDPEFSWKFAVAPGGIGFLGSSALGREYRGDLFVGSAVPAFDGGYLLRFDLTDNRKRLDFDDRRLRDGVADNTAKFNATESESLRFGTGFGITTDIQTGPNGNLYVVSFLDGAVYEIFRKDAAATFLSTNLVSDIPNPPGGAPVLIDPNLKNPWGVSFSPTSPMWVSNQGTNTSTLYSSNATGTTVTKAPLTVTIPTTAAGPQGPTGQVFNGTTDFKLANGNPARFIFANLNGTISAWNAGTAATIVATVPGAVYTGLAIGNNGAGNFLYAANVAQGRIDVFDATFTRVASFGGGFADPNLPAGVTTFHPFNVQNLNGTLYVTYENRADREHGGIVNAFDQNGNFLRRVVSGGVNAPWGLALAPADFGRFSGALLVGNFGLGDGKINAYDPNTGEFLGHLTDANGNPLAFERLWAIAFGNGTTGGRNILFFTAGINDEENGLFGSIRALQPTPPPPDDGDGGRKGGKGRGGSDGGLRNLIGLFLPPDTDGGKDGRRAGVWENLASGIWVG
jgi:uncharacterized protein (TIGR03118 family)